MKKLNLLNANMTVKITLYFDKNYDQEIMFSQYAEKIAKDLNLPYGQWNEGDFFEIESNKKYTSITKGKQDTIRCLVSSCIKIENKGVENFIRDLIFNKNDIAGKTFKEIENLLVKHFPETKTKMNRK